MRSYLILSFPAWKYHVSIIFSNFTHIIFLIFMSPIESAHMKKPRIIRMTITKGSPHPIIMKIMRIPSSLSILHTLYLFKDTYSNCIFHPHSSLFIILHWTSCPVIRVHVGIVEMDAINYSIPKYPHSEPTIRVYCILLDISVHFVGMVEGEPMGYIYFWIGSY